MLDIIPQFGSLLWTIVAFVVALSVIVAIHEFGHYIVGRWCGIKADVFSLGFGPVAYAREDRHGTRWQIAILPFGGYVKFAGDANAASGMDPEAMAEVQHDPVAYRATMHGAPVWARSLTVAAGPVFNFALSILIFFGIALAVGVPRDPVTIEELAALPDPVAGLQAGDVVLGIEGIPLPSVTDPDFHQIIAQLPLQPVLTYQIERDGQPMDVDGPYTSPPLASRIAPNSAAYDAGILPGDVISHVDGQPIFAFQQIKDVVEGSDGRAIAITIWRSGESHNFTLVPKRTDEPQPEGGFATHMRIGIGGGLAFETANEAPGIGEAASRAVQNTWRIITGSISGLGHMITGAISTCNMSGPIGIAQVSGAMASQGTASFINFIAVLSTAVGLLNLFPIPALDGGHLVFHAYEAVTGKPPSDNALRILMSIGIALVLCLMIFALGNDLFCP